MNGPTRIVAALLVAVAGCLTPPPAEDSGPRHPGQFHLILIQVNATAADAPADAQSYLAYHHEYGIRDRVRWDVDKAEVQFTASRRADLNVGPQDSIVYIVSHWRSLVSHIEENQIIQKPWPFFVQVQELALMRIIPIGELGGESFEARPHISIENDVPGMGKDLWSGQSWSYNMTRSRDTPLYNQTTTTFDWRILDYTINVEVTYVGFLDRDKISYPE